MGNMNNKTILLTGGLGYIGSHTAVELILEGYEVIIVDNLSNSNSETFKGIVASTQRSVGYLKRMRIYPQLYVGDLAEDPTFLTRLIESFGAMGKKIDAVIHFAAKKYVGESVKMPMLYYDNNMKSIINLLHNIENLGNKIVFSSSCTVYGQPVHTQVSEDMPFGEPTSPYGHTKIMSEQILMNLANSPNSQFDCISLRYFNPIGNHRMGFIPEKPKLRPENIMPYILEAAKTGMPMKVFGDDYATEDGTAIRDYIHVVDLAKAHVKALDRMLYGMVIREHYEAFNIGLGRGISVYDLIRLFENTNKVTVPYEVYPRRYGDAREIYANNSKAINILGWEPEHTIEDALRSAWDSYIH